MKDSTAIQIAKNLPGIRIKADLDWIIFMGVIGTVAWKTLDYYVEREKRKAKEAEAETHRLYYASQREKREEYEASKNKIEEEPETSEE